MGVVAGGGGTSKEEEGQEEEKQVVRATMMVTLKTRMFTTVAAAAAQAFADKYDEKFEEQGVETLSRFTGRTSSCGWLSEDSSAGAHPCISHDFNDDSKSNTGLVCHAQCTS